ncbi:MAG: hypothetical protein WAM69_09465 [Candidatus Sulfotelmatobacter sp.]
MNPILAAHLGRWAEVYFTSPPEKRGQAISELLRELANVPPPDSAALQVIDDENERGQQTAKLDSPSAAGEDVQICGACAYKNSPGYTFCGMCGAPLQITPEAHTTQAWEAEPTAGANGMEVELSPGSESAENTTEPSVSAAAHRSDPLVPTWRMPERPVSDLGVKSEPSRHGYRIYIGVGLAIALAVSAYMARHRTEEPSSGSASSPPAPSRIIRPAAAGSSPPPREMESAPAENNPAAVLTPSRPDANALKDQAAGTRPTPPMVPLTASSSATADQQSGAEDLATAEKYLNGTPGTPRDTREAAQWLWLAVRKRNLAATIALSDLYLLGDGVPKSCDQARVLLDAAAERGGKGAAVRLRNLQAFGCQ